VINGTISASEVPTITMEAKMKKPALFPTFIICLLLSACAEPGEQTAASVQEDIAAIGEVRQQLIDALEADDVDGIMSRLTDDHITMPPNEPAPATLEALRSWHERRITDFTFDGDLPSQEIQLAGDWAFDHWSSTFSLTSRDDGAVAEYVGKGLWIWHRASDGTWKLARSIWNLDDPGPDNQ